MTCSLLGLRQSQPASYAEPSEYHSSLLEPSTTPNRSLLLNRSLLGYPPMKSATHLIAALICAAAGALVPCSKSIAAAPPQLYRVELVLEEEPAAAAPRCILSLCCWTVLLPEVGPIAHCYTVCTQEGSEAAPRGCRGGPAGLFNNERSQALTYSGCPVSADPSIPAPPANGDPCSSASGTGIWGSIAAGCGRFEGKHPDNSRWFTKCNHFVVDCDACACIERTMEHINCCCFRYEPLLLFGGYNSNSVVFTALQRCTSLLNLAPLPLPIDPIGWTQMSDHASCPCNLSPVPAPTSGCN